MTTSTSLSGAALAPKPPAKGSFPLDHLAECREFARAYETCLEKHDKISSHCRKEARLYLQCRMERGLMVKEEWEKLGLGDDKIGSEARGKDAEERAEAKGFIAGARSAKRRKERYKKGTQEEGAG